MTSEATTNSEIVGPADSGSAPPAAGGSSSARRWPFASLVTAGLLALAAALRFETLGRRPLWFDEQVTLYLSQQARDLAEFFRIAREDGFEHPALHPFLTSVFLPFFDDPALAIRVPSALAGIASVGLLVWLCRELWDREVAWLSGLLLAIGVYHINYSQDARAYPFLIVCGIGQYLSILYFMRGTSLRPLLVFPVLGVTCLYLHHVGILLQASVGITFLGLLLLAQRETGGDDGARQLMRRRWIAFAAAYAAILVLYAPQLPLLLQFQETQDPKLDGGRTVLRWLNLSPRFFHALIVRWGNGAAVAPLYELLFAVGLVALLRQGRNALFLLPWLVLPFLFFGFVPFERWFDIRYLITSLPAFLSVAALGGVSLVRLCRRGVEHFDPRPSRARMAAALAWIVVLAPIGSAATWNYLAFRATTVRCSEVMSARRNASTAEQGYCQQNLVLHSRHPHARFILRRQKVPNRRP